MAKRYKLRLTKLDFVSAVDMPAQSTATVAIIKRADDDAFEATFAVTKVDDEQGIVMGFAFTSTVDGKPYYDQQGDAIDESDVVRVAAEWVAQGALSDQQHDEKPIGKAVFCWPLTTDIAKAFEIETKKTGLLVGIKPSPDVLAKFKSGEYSGFSIGGLGQRSAAKGMQVACSKCGQFMEKGLQQCPACGAQPTMAGKRAQPASKGMWSTAMVDDLPDSSFLYVEDGGKKDDDGKTIPRTLRMFPYKTATGAVDLPHLRDAIGRIPQSSLPSAVKEKLQAKAEKLLGAQHEKDDAAKAASGKSTLGGGVRSVGSMDEAQIAEMKKQLARLERVAKLSGAQKAHFDSLTANDAEAADAFLAKTNAERDAVVTEAIKSRSTNDEIVYTSPVDGTVYRKSDEPRLVAMAKQLAASIQERDQERLEKRATSELSHVAKSLPVRAALLRAVDGIADEKVRGEVVEALKGANAALVAVSKSAGFDPMNDANSADAPIAKFNTALAEFAKAEKKTIPQATEAFCRTPEGALLYAEAFSGNPTN